MRSHRGIPDDVLGRLGRMCLALPEARQEMAWVGVRWRVRTKTFAHVLMIDAGWPPAYVKAAGTDGPACVLTFRSRLHEIDDQAFRQPPFFKPVWWPDIAGMFLDRRTDWEDVSSWVAASYRMLAPLKLRKLVR